MAIDYQHPRRKESVPPAAESGSSPAVPGADSRTDEVGSPPRPTYEHPRRRRSAPAGPSAPDPTASAAPPPPPPPPPPVDELDPQDLLQLVLNAEIRGRARIAGRRRDLQRIAGLADAVGDSLGLERPVLGADRDALLGENIDVRELEAMLTQFHTAYGMRGQFRRTSLRPRIDEALNQLHAGLRAKRDRAAQALASAERQHADALASLRRRRPEADAFMADRQFLYEDRRGYVGAGEAEKFADRIPRLSPRSWIAAPLDGQPWAELPFAAADGLTWLSGPGTPYPVGCEVVRGQVLEHMANAYPRRLVVTWIDPVGRGASAGALLELLEIDKSLLDNQVWAEPDEIDQALRRVTERMTYLEQRCLKSRFADLDEYNVQAGSLAEAYQIIVVTGYPRAFSEDADLRLAQIQQNGRRLGITIHVVTDDETAAPVITQKHGYPAFHSVRMPTPGSTGLFGNIVFGNAGRPHVMMYADAVEDVVWVPATFPRVGEGRARAIVEGYARAAVEAADVVIDADGLFPRTQDAPSSSADEIVLPVGALGRGDRFDLRLGRGLAQNVLVGGLPGSGKSTLFHSVICAAIRSYPPSELELHLLDFKEGVEFQPYAAAELPHARTIAIQSQRVFGLSVLRGLVEELTARAGRFKTVGASSIAEFRARTGEQLPRVLVVIDEFQVLFAAEDATAFECAELMENLIRQGRSYGVHMILGTQSMRGATQRLLRPALDLVALRVVLKCSESDSELFLASDNRAASRLSRPGEAIFNPDGGSPEGNLAFQVALTSEDSRDAVLERARADARSAGWTRRPLVFDGTRQVTVEDDDKVIAQLTGRGEVDARTIPLHWGLPVAISGDGSVRLWRRGGAHALLVERDGGRLHGPLVVGLVTACLSAARPVITVVDCLGVDEDNGMQLAEIAQALPRTRCVRRRQLVEVLAEAAAEVRRRTEADDYSAPREVLVINAVQRARDLDDADSFAPSGASGDLAAILRDGADVGIHVVLAVDTLDALQRRIGRDGLGQLGLRLVGQCSPAASDVLVGTAAASDLGPEYMLVSDADEGLLEQIKPFPVPSVDWIRAMASGHN